MLFVDHTQMEMQNCKISVGNIESNTMGNKEIEAWAEGVIIGAWPDSWTKPESRCNAPGSGVPI